MKKPTVTELINLLDKPNLLKWANRIGLEGMSLEDYRKGSKKDGVNVHRLIENDFKGFLKYDNEVFQNWKLRYEVVQVEPNIECEFYYGRADVLLKKDHMNFLFDFKNADKIYFEQVIQLVAYKRVLKPDKIGIVNSSTFKETVLDISPFQEKQYTNILSGLVHIYNAKHELNLV